MSLIINTNDVIIVNITTDYHYPYCFVIVLIMVVLV